jgi:hypothetical protein
MHLLRKEVIQSLPGVFRRDRKLDSGLGHVAARGLALSRETRVSPVVCAA